MPGQCNLAVCYLNGNGVEQDAAAAVRWLESGGPGECPGTEHPGRPVPGRGGHRNGCGAGLPALYPGGGQGYPPAQCALGYCYEVGSGTAEDKTKAVEWYERPRGLGHTTAQCNLAYCYEQGIGVAEDKTKAVEWYARAAEQEHPRAMCNLGLCYEVRRGVWRRRTRLRRQVV